MAAGRGTIRLGAAAAALLACLLFGRPVLAQAAAELKPLGSDEARQVDRYQVILHPGAALWDVANTYLPLTALDQGDAKAYELVLESFQRAFPGRSPGQLQPDDTFTLEVPSGTFVTEKLARDPNSITLSSFQGDQLTYYTRHPSVIYRLVRKEAPDKAEIKLTGQAGSAAELAREIYQTDPPDFIQVRMIRAALNDPNARVTVDLTRKYLDDFRNYRERATSVKDAEGGKKIYTFGPDDRDNPFVQVEDAVGDQNDPGAFPKEFRLAFYRDGTVRKYMVTESGDALSTLNKPDTARWQKVLPSVTDWQQGAVEPLPPFTPPVNQAGSLIPGRLLVLSFAPKAAPAASPDARGTARAGGSGLTCLGIPLAMLGGLGIGGWGVGLVRRRSGPDLRW